MLEPQSRAAFTELLKPPAGFELKYAVGTTFTLDLATALMVPLSFASHRVSANDEKLGVLNAVSRASHDIDVFAQAGHLSTGTHSDLVAFLEPMIHPVTTTSGLFHPKVWVLKYQSDTRAIHRFLCGSRNLTGDRSWDVIACLDESDSTTTSLEARAQQNAPLVSFVRALPAMAVQPLEDRRFKRIESFANELSTIEWDLPEGARSIAFHALGIGESRAPRPDFSGRRSLVISPFVSLSGLSELRSGVREKTHLLSRAETLDKLDADAFDNRLTTYVLDDAATLESDDEDGNKAERLSGLHAKVVSVDRRFYSHLFLGSANATDAALQRNVEMMIEIEGKTGLYGVEALLNALGDLKVEYETHGDAELDLTEEAARNLEARLRDLGSIRVNVKVIEADPYDLRVWVEDKDANAFTQARDAGVEVRWQLLTRADLGAEHIAAGEQEAELFKGVGLTDITPFIVLTGKVTAPDGTLCERRTILLAQLHNDIPNRRDAIVASKLTDKAAFMRLLTLMLELSGVTITFAGDAGAVGFFGSAGAGDAGGGAGLFEALMHAVASGHSGLVDAKRIIDFIRSQGDERSVLPEGFDDLWNQIWRAHLELTGGES